LAVLETWAASAMAVSVFGHSGGWPPSPHDAAFWSENRSGCPTSRGFGDVGSIGNGSPGFWPFAVRIRQAGGPICKRVSHFVFANG
ncbi:MAG: hypothetical protein DMG80_06350, partial [Acidobacteria bacterium]